MEKLVQHPHGLERAAADYLIWGVSPYGDHRVREQLWAKEIGPFTFRLCCLPFYLYGFSLGDIVTTGENLVLDRVVERSDRSLLRFWFQEGCSDVEGVEAQLARFGARFEWFTYKLVSIDVAREQLGELTAWLDQNGNSLGLEYEIGNE